MYHAKAPDKNQECVICDLLKNYQQYDVRFVSVFQKISEKHERPNDISYMLHSKINHYQYTIACRTLQVYKRETSLQELLLTKK